MSEPLTDEERRAVDRALEDERAGRVVPLEQWMREDVGRACGHGRVGGAGCPHCLGPAWGTSGKLTQEKFRGLVDEGQREREHFDCATGRCHGVHCRRCKETTP